jgi:hypothetical protein
MDWTNSNVMEYMRDALLGARVKCGKSSYEWKIVRGMCVTSVTGSENREQDMLGNEAGHESECAVDR